MSIVGTAIIAGATAALSGASSDAVTTLYNALKKAIQATVHNLSFDSLEASPGDDAVQNRILSNPQITELDQNSDLRDIASALIQEVQKFSQAQPAPLIEVDRLIAKENITISDVDTDTAILKAQKIETDGTFTFTQIRKSNAGADPVPGNIGPAIQTNELKAQSIHFFNQRILNIPRYVIFIICAILAVVLFMFSGDILRALDANATKRHNFDTTYATQLNGEMGSEYMSSVNYILTVIPENIFQTREYDHWDRVSYSLDKHVGRVEAFYAPIADGLASGEMKPGERKGQACDQILALTDSLAMIDAGLGQIRGISIDYTGSGAPELSVFGPVVQFPNYPKLSYLRETVCNASDDAANTAQPADDASNDIARRLRQIDQEIAAMREYAQRDWDDELEQCKRRFVSTYSSWLQRQGMPRGSAQAEAESELRSFLRGSASTTYTVPGLNDASDCILNAQRGVETDFDAIIEQLETEKASLEGPQ